ncbi:MAG: oxaloacetate decarboxylase, partial [Candidatus Egerieousia sp.]
KLPGPLAPEIIDIVKAKGLEFYTGNPQDAFPNELPKFEKMMEEEGWDRGEDDEELFEFAMHERQYRDYKSGIAKERFQKALEDAKAKAGAPIIVTRPVVEVPKIDIEKVTEKYPDAKPIQSTAKGRVVWQIAVAGESTAPVVGTSVKEGDVVCRIETYYGYEEVKALASGKYVAVYPKQGELVQKDEVIAFIA